MNTPPHNASGQASSAKCRSTPPERFRDRWRDRADPGPGQGVLYWHMLVGAQPAIARLARIAQEQVGGIGGFHMTPLEWLHITTVVGGPCDQVPASGLQQMIATASRLLADVRPASVSVGKLLYHPEAIMLAVEPEDALVPIRDAARVATSSVKRDGDGDAPWKPHITLCYSTACQPAGPVIAVLGEAFPAQKIRIDTVSLVIQHGPERQWDWKVAGTIPLAASMADR